MPSKSAKQARTMRAAAHDPEFAKKIGIPTKVAKEFTAADKGRRFGTGGSATISHGGQKQINKQQTRYGSIFGNEKNIPNVNLNKYVGKKEGGLMKHDDLMEDKKLIKKAVGMHDKQLHGGKKTELSKLKKGGCTKMCGGGKTKKMASGGLTAGHKSADGCAVRGKTKGSQVKMKG